MTIKLSPTNIADRMGAIARVSDQPELCEQRKKDLYVEFTRHVANTEAVPETVRRKARTILELEKW
jgi:hypothetical protein